MGKKKPILIDIMGLFQTRNGLKNPMGERRTVVPRGIIRPNSTFMSFVRSDLSDFCKKSPIIDHFSAN